LSSKSTGASLQPFGSLLFFQTISGHPRRWAVLPCEHHILQSLIFFFYLRFSNKGERAAASNDTPAAKGGGGPHDRPLARHFFISEQARLV
jgi:hypothetical protein